jgi:hypothetical protein
MPDNLRYGGGVADTVLNPAVAAVLIVAGVLILALPRRKSFAPFLTAAILIPNDQVLVVAGLHFPVLRILILFGIARMLMTGGRVFPGGRTKIDTCMLAFAVVSATAGVLLWQNTGALVYQLGELYTTLGAYVLVRYFIRDRDDIATVTRTLAYLACVIGAVMIFEQARGWNPYALLGGARASSYASILQRDGKFRAMGCFAQPIPAGTFGAVLIPLFFALWRSNRRNAVIALAGAGGATAMALTSNSSTPLLAYIAGVLGLCLWPLQSQMRLIRWGIVMMLVSLHMVMKAPVWHLISRIDLSGGSSSYHRYQLVDQFIRHFGDWWLVGTKSNADWGWWMWDTANQYVAVGQSSGLLSFLLFIALIAYGFSYIGKSRRNALRKRDAVADWAIGCALFGQAVGFFGISYFDQAIMIWFLLLAIISAAAADSGLAHGKEPMEEKPAVTHDPDMAATAAAQG